LGAGPVIVTNFTNVATSASAGPFTPQGVDNYDPSATEGYFIGSDTTVFSRLQVRRISNPAGTPSISGNLSINVAATTNPISNVLSNGSAGVDGIDDRLFAAHIRDGRLWTAHNIQTNSSGVANTSGGRTSTRWYELGNLSTTPSVVQSGTVFDNAATPRSYWVPSIMVNGQGHAAIGFSTAASNTNIDAATVGRLSTDTLGTTQGTPIRYTNSAFIYNPSFDTGTPKRWGDYSYTALDPCDDMTMWTIQQFTNASNSYGVQAVRLLSPTPTLANCATATSVAQGASNVVINLTGTGFYDTDASAGACRTRLNAVLSGTGLTVNSITVNSPTSVSLSVSATASAAIGARSISLSNPDAQATGAVSNCINVVSGATSISSLTRASANPACSNTSIAWNANFAAGVSGLSNSNFQATNAATVTGVTGSASSYVVNVNSGANAGTTGLNMSNSTGVAPSVTNLPFTGETYTVNPMPVLFNVTGGGAGCTNGTGVAVGLAGSSNGVSYQLKRSGVNAGTPLPGTGAAIAFGAQTQAGNYTVDASIAGCPVRTMTGNANVTINQSATLNPVSSNPICSGQQTNIPLSGTPAGATFNFTATAGAGSVSGFANGSVSIIAQNLTGFGSVIYNITASANGCPSAAQNLTQQVANPQLVQTSLPTAFVGQPYFAQLTATGMVGAPSFDVFVGNLPGGITLNATGALTGTPTLAGTTNLQMRVRDQSISACENIRPLSLVVSDDIVFKNGFEDLVSAKRSIRK
jgi:hypothetical protein